jgi:hypothetical protein
VWFGDVDLNPVTEGGGSSLVYEAVRGMGGGSFPFRSVDPNVTRGVDDRPARVSLCTKLEEEGKIHSCTAAIAAWGSLGMLWDTMNDILAEVYGENILEFGNPPAILRLKEPRPEMLSLFFSPLPVLALRLFYC